MTTHIDVTMTVSGASNLRLMEPVFKDGSAYVSVDGDITVVDVTADDAQAIADAWHTIAVELDRRTICEPTAPSVNSEASGSAGVPFDSGIAS